MKSPNLKEGEQDCDRMNMGQSKMTDLKISNNHCFYITFDTNHPDVLISPKLKKEYPKEITIVIQNQFC